MSRIPPGTVLDLGAGAGRHSRLAELNGHRPILVDISPVGLTSARSIVRSSLLCVGSMANIPLNSESIDTIICFGTLYYLAFPALQGAIGECHRVLRTGGHAIFVTRSTRDHRFASGEEIGHGTAIVKANTGESGMVNSFLDETEVGEHFTLFSTVIVDIQEFSIDNQSELNSDWIIEVGK